MKSNIMINDGTNDLLSLQNLCDSNIYSTTEKVVGKWIDGKPLYRKVFTGNWASNETTVTTLNTNCNVVSMRGLIKSKYGFQWNIPNVADEDGYRSALRISNSTNKIIIKTGNFYETNNTYIVIIEYTKSTD